MQFVASSNNIGVLVVVVMMRCFTLYSVTMTHSATDVNGMLNGGGGNGSGCGSRVSDITTGGGGDGWRSRVGDITSGVGRGDGGRCQLLLRLLLRPLLL